MNALLVLLAVQGQVLTLDDALRTAAAHQPQIVQAHATTEIYRARANEARAPLLPQLNGNGSYSRRTSNFVPQPSTNISNMMGTTCADGSTPMGGLCANGACPVGQVMIGGMCTNPANAATLTWNTVNYWSFGLTLTQTLFDWGNFERWRSSKEVASSQAAGEANTVQQIDLQVRTNFFQARAQKALVQVARDTLANQDRHLQQIEGFVRAGTRPEIDLAQARTDRANARVQLITAENNYLIAKAQLNQSMGVQQDTGYDVSDETLPPVDIEDQNLEDIVAVAMKARPDVIALEKQLRAQHLSVSSAYGGFMPTLGAAMSLTDAGTDISNLAWNWGFTVNASWALFNGLNNWYQVKEQKAQLVVAAAQLEQQKLQVRLDVEQARLAVRAAKENIVATDEALANARERLRLAEGRYQAGVGNIIELGDAQVALTNAAGQKVSAEYNLGQARAQLVKALGRR